MLTKNATRAIANYGVKACRKAFRYHQQGYGAAGIANGCDVGRHIRTTRQADAAIDAGRELAAMDRAVWC